MAARSEREKLKMQEKYQITLAQMLKEEDNKYCVDCDTKNPRWASWNIGVFICIRCAGFHRNLGVHISKVKSVNLDSWTAEQITAIQAMGNSRARAVYEANLPDGFRRPQSDSALESFIRAKYEKRKWIAKEWIPPEITVPIDLIESESNEQSEETIPEKPRIENATPKLKPFPLPSATRQPVSSSTESTAAIATENLLNLDEPSGTSANILDPLHGLFAPVSHPTNGEEKSIDKELQSAFSSSNDAKISTVLTKEKIMALFNTPPMMAPSPQCVYPPTQLLPPQKSMSFCDHLSQQVNHSGSPIRHEPSLPSRSGMTSSITHQQLNTQFAHLTPFANTRSNTSAAALISHMPMRPVTEYMPASSDPLWQ